MLRNVVPSWCFVRGPKGRVDYARVENKAVAAVESIYLRGYDKRRKRKKKQKIVKRLTRLLYDTNV